jgi:hypothetical protein
MDEDDLTLTTSDKVFWTVFTILLVGSIAFGPAIAYFIVGPVLGLVSPNASNQTVVTLCLCGSVGCFSLGLAVSGFVSRRFVSEPTLKRWDAFLAGPLAGRYQGMNSLIRWVLIPRESGSERFLQAPIAGHRMPPKTHQVRWVLCCIGFGAIAVYCLFGAIRHHLYIPSRYGSNPGFVYSGQAAWLLAESAISFWGAAAVLAFASSPRVRFVLGLSLVLLAIALCLVANHFPNVT